MKVVLTYSLDSAIFFVYSNLLFKKSVILPLHGCFNILHTSFPYSLFAIIELAFGLLRMDMSFIKGMSLLNEFETNTFSDAWFFNELTFA